MFTGLDIIIYHPYNNKRFYLLKSSINDTGELNIEICEQ